MNTNILPFPASGQVSLLVAPDSACGTLFEMVAHMALQGPLYVLDAGNTFQGYPLAHSLRQKTVDVAGVMGRVLLSRAFTCYQMAALCTEESFAPYPILVLDFLSTFYDQGVYVGERRRLLKLCLRRLALLSRNAPVAVWVRQRSTIPEEALSFLDIVQAAAGVIWQPERPALAGPLQPSLLPER
jgi:hypothetical protein